jgi:hypothetical protein
MADRGSKNGGWNFFMMDGREAEKVRKWSEVTGGIERTQVRFYL